MRRPLGEIKTLALSFFGRALVRKGVLTVVAVFFVLQFYVVRELLAAELLFGLGFVVLLVAAALSYLVGSAGERGLEFAEVGVRLIRGSARRGFSNLAINRKPFRLAGKIVSPDTACLLGTRRAINWMLLSISSAARAGSLIDK